MKITRGEDLVRARLILQAREERNDSGDPS